MINYALGISSQFGVSFWSTPHKPECESVAVIFGSHIRFSFYRDFLHQLLEVQNGNRLKFNFSDDPDYVDMVPSEAVEVQLTVISPESIKIDDFYIHKQIIVATKELIKIVENWVKFVEVNTEAFEKKQG
jgi:hypothetical protein